MYMHPNVKVSYLATYVLSCVNCEAVLLCGALIVMNCVDQLISSQCTKYQGHAPCPFC